MEATKYTEVGYHGDDITNVVNDLYKKTQSEMSQKDGQSILKGSKILSSKIEQILLKYIVGPSFDQNPQYEQKKALLKEGKLDNYSCFLYLPGESSGNRKGSG